MNQLLTFFDSLISNSFITNILKRDKNTSHSESFIDKIFTIFISHEVMSGNIAATISDHLPQFLFVANILSNHSNKISDIYEIDWSKCI